MIGSIIGAVAKRRKGRSGVKGAIEGFIVERGLKKFGPAAGVATLGYGAFRVIKKLRNGAIRAPGRKKGAAMGSAAI